MTEKSAVELHLEAVTDYHAALQAETLAKQALATAEANLRQAKDKMEQARLRAVSSIQRGKLP